MVSMMRWLILALLIATGCVATDPTPRHGQAEAIQLIWREAYGETTDPPVIEWVTTPNCRWGAGTSIPDGWPGFLNGPQQCVTGVYYSSSDTVRLIPGDMFPDQQAISFSSFAHELMHAHQQRQGIDDTNHQRTGDWVRATSANKLLVDRGL